MRSLRSLKTIVDTATTMAVALAAIGEIAEKLWLAAGVLAALGAWDDADEGARLAKQLDPTVPPVAGSSWFRGVARVSPRAALRIREVAIRVLKPRYRDRKIGWRSAVSVVWGSGERG